MAFYVQYVHFIIFVFLQKKNYFVIERAENRSSLIIATYFTAFVRANTYCIGIVLDRSHAAQSIAVSCNDCVIRHVRRIRLIQIRTEIIYIGQCAA